MPEHNLTDRDYLDLYTYLLEALQAKGFSDLRREIETAATVPVFEEGTPDEEEKILAEFKGEVGQRVVRRKEPSEAFFGAMDTLWTRLTELPQLVSRIERHLGSEARRIEFRLDEAESYSSEQVSSVGLSSLSLTHNEHDEIIEILKVISDSRLPAQLEYGHETRN
jgi:anaerobic selenocysteine-containing dehydrogenase